MQKPSSHTKSTFRILTAEKTIEDVILEKAIKMGNNLSSQKCLCRFYLLVSEELLLGRFYHN